LTAVGDLPSLGTAVLHGQARKEVADPVRPLGGGEVRAVEGKAGEAAGVMEGHAVHQERVWIALPSSPVTDVPGAPASVLGPTLRSKDRWDDYLPPSPKSMEDSGFWERPQPGAADFWAADEDDANGREGDGGSRAYAGRQGKGSGHD
jgi:hypothetical protein